MTRNRILIALTLILASFGSASAAEPSPDFQKGWSAYQQPVLGIPQLKFDLDRAMGICQLHLTNLGPATHFGWAPKWHACHQVEKLIEDRKARDRAAAIAAQDKADQADLDFINRIAKGK